VVFALLYTDKASSHLLCVSCPKSLYFPFSSLALSRGDYGWPCCCLHALAPFATVCILQFWLRGGNVPLETATLAYSSSLPPSLTDSRLPSLRPLPPFLKDSRPPPLRPLPPSPLSHRLKTIMAQVDGGEIFAIVGSGGGPHRAHYGGCPS
jgi:hypothetical protein